MEKNIVTKVGDDLYEIKFVKPIKGKAGLLFMGSQRLKVTLTKDQNKIKSIIGSPQVLIDWYKSMNIADSVIKELEQMMKD